MDRDAMAEALGALSRYLVNDASVGDTLLRVAQLATSAIPAADFAGITLITERRPRTAVFTDPAAPEIDQAQYDADSGPCVDAHKTGEVLVIDDTGADGRWPEFCAAAKDHGISSTLSMPLRYGDQTIGALNFYSHLVTAFDGHARDDAEIFAAPAAVVLANSQAYWDAHALAEHLQEAMVSRAVIEQAKGILMAQSQVGADAAFGLLVRASQRENRKLRDIAAELVERYQDDPSSDPGTSGS